MKKYLLAIFILLVVSNITKAEIEVILGPQKQKFANSPSTGVVVFDAKKNIKPPKMEGLQMASSGPRTINFQKPQSNTDKKVVKFKAPKRKRRKAKIDVLKNISIEKLQKSEDNIFVIYTANKELQEAYLNLQYQDKETVNRSFYHLKRSWNKGLKQSFKKYNIPEEIANIYMLSTIVSQPSWDGTIQQESPKEFAREIVSLSKTFKDNWLLVLAAYDLGENKVKQIIKDTSNPDYWYLMNTLPDSTNNFINEVIATSFLTYRYL